MRNYHGLLEAIGNTPIISLDNLFSDSINKFYLYAKLEYLNPGGSAKDRSGYSMMLHARDEGLINEDTVIIESSSGNLGIALAQICMLWNLKFICVIDPKTTLQNIQLLKLYGAQIEYVSEPDKETGEFLQARINRVNELLKEYGNSYRPNQYANLYNPEGHKKAAKEIFDYFKNDLDYIFCAVSTCGTIRGYSEYIKNNGLATKVIAVDAVGSVIFGDERKKRLIPGHGAAIVPQLYNDGIADECIHVSDIECLQGCRKLLKQEGIFAGGSTGAVVSAIEKYIPRIESSAKCAFIVHDRGERYLNNIYSDAWVKEHFNMEVEL